MTAVTDPAGTATGAAPATPPPAPPLSGAPAPPRLHLPDEPRGREGWRDRVLAGEDLGAVLVGGDGLAAWLWSRWQVLDRAGIDRGAFDGLVLAYRRELWLWLHGDRTWAQCCSGLIGRIERRLPR